MMIQTTTLFLALSFELSALSFAAEKLPDVMAVSTQAAVVESTAPLTAEQVIDRLEAADGALKSLHAGYTQSLKIPGYGIDQSGDGELWFVKERKLRIEQKSPKKQTVVSDGDSIWIHNPETNQVIVQNWKAFEKSQMVSRGLTQFGSYSKLRERYSVSASSEPGKAGGPPVYTVTLRPKDIKDIPFVLELTLGPPDFIPTRTKMNLNDMEVVTALTGLEVNPALDDKVFVYEPPAGATLLKTGP